MTSTPAPTLLRAPVETDRWTISPLAVVAVVLVWITFVLWQDADGGRWLQRGLGVGTWIVLGAVLTRVTPLVRAQTAVVVAFASVVEYTFSPLLEVYTYRFDNVPMYVPPGHGLVYLAALAIGELTWVRTRLAVARWAVVILLGAYASYGLVLSERTDVLGAFWFVCLVGFLWRGPSVGLYVGAAVVVTYLEVIGTRFGTWAWQRDDPTGLVPIGNPPTGAAGGYGWFDLAALLLAPTLLAFARRLAHARGHPPTTA